MDDRFYPSHLLPRKPDSVHISQVVMWRGKCIAVLRVGYVMSAQEVGAWEDVHPYIVEYLAENAWDDFEEEYLAKNAREDLQE